MQSEVLAFTEFEEDIAFDVDDPDFADGGRISGTSSLRTPVTCSMEARVPSPMSLAGVRAIELPRSQSCDALRCMDDVHCFLQDASVLTIEELRLQLNSCFTCGVSWHEDHVSLDCAECGGYALERPCPRCEGKCTSVWKRDLTLSHTCGKARWLGECAAQTRASQPRALVQPLPPDESLPC